MKARWIIALAALVLVVPAWAQDGPGEPGRPGRGGMRGGRGPGRRPDPAQMLERMSARMAQTLDLSEDQQAKLDEIVANFHARMPEGGPSDADRQLWEDLREARRNGDDERVAELREQMRASRGDRGEMMGEFFDEVEGILDEDQVGRLAEFRERFEDMRQQRGRQMSQRRMMRDLPEQLELTDEQRAQYDALIDDLRSERDSRRELWQQMRAAQDAGDEERAEQLREELRANRGERGGLPESFFENLGKILTEAQQAKLADLRSDTGRRGGGDRDELSVPGVMRAVQRLDLTSEQRTQIRELTQNAMHDSRGLGRRDREAQTKVATDLKAAIAALLNPEQTAEFEQLLKGERPERGRRGRGNSRGRGPAPSEPAPEKP